jgi:hypothetical protein
MPSETLIEGNHQMIRGFFHKINDEIKQLKTMLQEDEHPNEEAKRIEEDSIHSHQNQ